MTARIVLAPAAYDRLLRPCHQDSLRDSGVNIELLTACYADLYQHFPDPFTALEKALKFVAVRGAIVGSVGNRN